MDERRWFHLDLPDETICLDVPAVRPNKLYRSMEAEQQPTNMIWDTRQRLRLDYNSQSPLPRTQLEPKGYPVNMIYDPGPARQQEKF